MPFPHDESCPLGRKAAPVFVCLSVSAATYRSFPFGQGVARNRATPSSYEKRRRLSAHERGRHLSPPFQGMTLATLVGLVYATRMRVGEALRLDRGDVDCRQRLIVVANSKFGKSRELPMQESTASALVNYAKRRDRCARGAPRHSSSRRRAPVCATTTSVTAGFASCPWESARQV